MVEQNSSTEITLHSEVSSKIQDANSDLSRESDPDDSMGKNKGAKKKGGSKAADTTVLNVSNGHNSTSNGHSVDVNTALKSGGTYRIAEVSIADSNGLSSEIDKTNENREEGIAGDIICESEQDKGLSNCGGNVPPEHKLGKRENGNPVSGVSGIVAKESASIEDSSIERTTSTNEHDSTVEGSEAETSPIRESKDSDSVGPFGVPYNTKYEDGKSELQSPKKDNEPSKLLRANKDLELTWMNSSSARERNDEAIQNEKHSQRKGCSQSEAKKNGVRGRDFSGVRVSDLPEDYICKSIEDGLKKLKLKQKEVKVKFSNYKEDFTFLLYASVNASPSKFEDVQSCQLHLNKLYKYNEMIAELEKVAISYIDFEKSVPEKPLKTDPSDLLKGKPVSLKIYPAIGEEKQKQLEALEQFKGFLTIDSNNKILKDEKKFTGVMKENCQASGSRTEREGNALKNYLEKHGMLTDEQSFENEETEFIEMVDQNLELCNEELLKNNHGTKSSLSLDSYRLQLRERANESSKRRVAEEKNGLVSGNPVEDRCEMVDSKLDESSLLLLQRRSEWLESEVQYIKHEIRTFGEDCRRAVTSLIEGSVKTALTLGFVYTCYKIGRTSAVRNYFFP